MPRHAMPKSLLHESHHSIAAFSKIFPKYRPVKTYIYTPNALKPLHERPEEEPPLPLPEPPLPLLFPPPR